MNPIKNANAFGACASFCKKYYNAVIGRRIILGIINSGRFGAGVTRISFTDPIRLKTHAL